MNKKIVYILIGLALIFFLTSLILFLRSKSETEIDLTKSTGDKSEKEISQPEFLEIKIFFYTEKSRYMIPITYNIENTSIRDELYRNFVSLLIQGEESYIAPIPPELKLKTSYYIERKKLLVLDFDEDLLMNFPGGTRAELEFIYYFVDNICFNFKEIKSVKFLVAGNEYKTISGHIDIENPFYPDFRYLRDE